MRDTHGTCVSGKGILLEIVAVGYWVADFDLGTSLLYRSELNHLFFHILVLPIVKNSTANNKK